MSWLNRQVEQAKPSDLSKLKLLLNTCEYKKKLEVYIYSAPMILNHENELLKDRYCRLGRIPTRMVCFS